MSRDVWSCRGRPDGPGQQFVLGLYCERCEIGLVAEEMARAPPQKWKLSELGWHRVNLDGSLGPPQQRMTWLLYALPWPENSFKSTQHRCFSNVRTLR